MRIQVDTSTIDKLQKLKDEAMGILAESPNLDISLATRKGKKAAVNKIATLAGDSKTFVGRTVPRPAVVRQ